jgi:hypothetical protein
MNGEVLLQNVFYLFIIAIILEASVMAIFSMAIMKKLSDRTPVEAARDALIILLAFILCYKVKLLTIFRGTGIKLPYLLDTVISGLVLARMTYFIREFLSKFRHD